MDEELDEELDELLELDELDELELDELLEPVELDDELPVLDELDDVLEPEGELDDGVGPVGLSPVVHATRLPTPASANPPDSTFRKSRRSARRLSASPPSRCCVGSCMGYEPPRASLCTSHASGAGDRTHEGAASTRSSR